MQPVFRRRSLSCLHSSCAYFFFLLPLMALPRTSSSHVEAAGLIPPPGKEKIPAVIIFGDSIADTGNNNRLKTLARCNFPPYGRDFEGAVPTGRFSNGKVSSDFIAEYLGVKELLPAYKDPNLRPEELITGVSFASGGSGFDPLTPRLLSVTPLHDQLAQFKEYESKLKGIIGEEGTNNLLAKSIFLVVASSNDIANTFFGFRVRASEYSVSSYADLLVDFASSFVQELHSLGARKIGVLGAPPVGCLPFTRVTAGGIQRQCNEDYNQAAQFFNSKLSAKLVSLNSHLQDAKLFYVDVYNPLLHIIENPRFYGFKVANEGCCGTGNLEIAILCNELNPFTCTNASEYVFWDSYHPTERAYKILVSRLVKENFIKLFGGN